MERVGRATQAARAGGSVMGAPRPAEKCALVDELLLGGMSVMQAAARARVDRRYARDRRDALGIAVNVGGCPIIDLTGQTFGRLEVISRAECPKVHLSERYRTAQWWACRCSCGAEKVASGKLLLEGTTTSCGCYQREISVRAMADIHARRAITPEKTETIKRSLRAGVPVTEIVKEVSVARERIVAIRNGLGLPKYSQKGKPQAVGNAEPFWTDDRMRQLRALWAQGHSTSEIGRRLGTSKSAIIGKSHRLALDARPSPIRRDVVKTNRRTPDRRAALAGPTLPVLEEAPMPLVEMMLLAARAALPSAPVLTLVPRKPSACCFPLWNDNERPTHRFCDDVAMPGRPYCGAHHAVCFVRTRRMQEAA